MGMMWVPGYFLSGEVIGAWR